MAGGNVASCFFETEIGVGIDVDGHNVRVFFGKSTKNRENFYCFSSFLISRLLVYFCKNNSEETTANIPQKMNMNEGRLIEKSCVSASHIP
jgi:hypothetical protein